MLRFMVALIDCDIPFHDQYGIDCHQDQDADVGK